MKALALFLALTLPSCAWLKDTARDAGECFVDAAKEADYLAQVEKFLADSTAWLARLTELGLEIGEDTVDCLVRRILSRPAAGTAEDNLVRTHGRMWLERQK